MVSLHKSDLFDDESDDDGTFPFCFDDSVGHVGDSVALVGKSVGRVSGVESGIFVPTGIESIGGVVPLVVFVPKGVKSKGGRLIEIFWRQKS